MVEQGSHIGPVRERNVRCLGAAEAAGVVADHAVALREGRHLSVPHAQVGDAGVDQGEWMTLALDLVVQPPAADIQESRLCHGPNLTDGRWQLLSGSARSRAGPLGWIRGLGGAYPALAGWARGAGGPRRRPPRRRA